MRELLQAVINLKRPDIKLLMIGSAGFGGNVVTPYVQEVQKLVEKAGERVKFTGYIENQKLYRYYQSADIQVIPSLWEEMSELSLERAKEFPKKKFYEDYIEVFEYERIGER